PNREVKPRNANGSAIICARVGSRQPFYYNVCIISSHPARWLFLFYTWRMTLPPVYANGEMQE
ncbi:MAG: hypothetical protein NW207_09195, partial [Cytophagales bacterium]|nr:hypothetical protein [Cytophagales bacterium]